MDLDYSTTGDPAASAGGAVGGLVVAIILIIALWRIFSKAGKPGWYAIIPILNVYTLVKISGNAGWMTILFFIPFVNVIATIIVALGLAKNFGKSVLFAIVGLVIFSVIGYLILAFDSSKYQGTSLNA